MDRNVGQVASIEWSLFGNKHLDCRKGFMWSSLITHPTKGPAIVASGGHFITLRMLSTDSSPLAPEWLKEPLRGNVSCFSTLSHLQIHPVHRSVEGWQVEPRMLIEIYGRASGWAWLPNELRTEWRKRLCQWIYLFDIKLAFDSQSS